MAFSDYFVGVPQSRWAGYAILAAVIAVALSILIGKDRIPVGKRVLIVLIMFLFALPTIALVLFQLTCLVNGTSKGPFCGWYAWIVAVLTIIYCILLIIIAITVKTSDKQADAAEKFSVSYEKANVMAKKLMGGSEMFEDMPVKEEEKEEVEKFGVPTSTSTGKPASVDGAAASLSAKTAKKEDKEDKKDEKKDKKEKFVDAASEEEEKEMFADYGCGAASVNGSANMYML